GAVDKGLEGATGLERATEVANALDKGADAGRALEAAADAEVDAAFRPWEGAPSEPYSTTVQLMKANLGERYAAESLAQEGHEIVMYKPDILETNQHGIDIVTLY